MDKIQLTNDFINQLKDGNNDLFLEGIATVYNSIMEGYESPVDDMTNTFNEFVNKAYQGSSLMAQLQQNEIYNMSRYKSGKSDPREVYHDSPTSFIRKEDYTVNGERYVPPVENADGFDALNAYDDEDDD